MVYLSLLLLIIVGKWVGMLASSESCMDDIDDIADIAAMKTTLLQKALGARVNSPGDPPPLFPECKAMTYPRTVPGILNRSDTKYLEELFFNKLYAFPNVYMKLWHHLNETRDPTVAHIIEKLDKYVQDHFGNEFIIWDDFYSLRQKGFKMFPGLHQDGMFWTTNNHNCEGFNLWILLNHHQYNKSFDVYEIDKNPLVYEGLDLSQPPLPALKDIWEPRINNNTYHAQASNIPLVIGEALVVKQPEIHSTDTEEMSSEEWRLGIGFKVVKKGTIMIDQQGETLHSDANFQEILDDPWFPRFEVGAQLWTPFNATLLHEYWQMQDTRKSTMV